MPSNQDDLVRIATLYLQVPGKVIKEYLGTSRYQELLECYKRVRKNISIPPQQSLFEENGNGGKPSDPRLQSGS